MFSVVDWQFFLECALYEPLYYLWHKQKGAQINKSETHDNANIILNNAIYGPIITIMGVSNVGDNVLDNNTCYIYTHKIKT